MSLLLSSFLLDYAHLSVAFFHFSFVSFSFAAFSFCLLFNRNFFFCSTKRYIFVVRPASSHIWRISIFEFSLHSQFFCGSLLPKAGLVANMTFFGCIFIPSGIQCTDCKIRRTVEREEEENSLFYHQLCITSDLQLPATSCKQAELSIQANFRPGREDGPELSSSSQNLEAKGQVQLSDAPLPAVCWSTSGLCSISGWCFISGCLILNLRLSDSAFSCLVFSFRPSILLLQDVGWLTYGFSIIYLQLFQFSLPVCTTSFQLPGFQLLAPFSSSSPM